LVSLQRHDHLGVAEHGDVGVVGGDGLHAHDIDADHADLKARGVDVDPEVSRMGDPVPPLLWFRDPDGNTLMLVETR
jgi:hypothetical protein